jgi:hypothetical protein
MVPVGSTDAPQQTVHSITPSEVAKSDGNGAMLMSRAAANQRSRLARHLRLPKDLALCIDNAHARLFQ